jgi:fumarylpyruvate hydrolase
VVAAPVRGRSERLPIGRIFCVGRNYDAHAREMGVPVEGAIEGVGSIRLAIGPAE